MLNLLLHLRKTWHGDSFWAVMRTPAYVVCEQQRCRSTSCLHSLTSTFIIRCIASITHIHCRLHMLNSKTHAGFCRWAGWFESYLVAHLQRQIFSWYGSFVLGWSWSILHLCDWQRGPRQCLWQRELRKTWPGWLHQPAGAEETHVSHGAKHQ